MVANSRCDFTISFLSIQHNSSDNIEDDFQQISNSSIKNGVLVRILWIRWNCANYFGLQFCTMP